MAARAICWRCGGWQRWRVLHDVAGPCVLPGAGGAQAGGGVAHPVSADRFRWHPEARVRGDGDDWIMPMERGLEAAGPAVILGQPAGLALARALAADQGFRIGGAGDAPAQGVQPMFETLTSGSTGAPRRIWRSQASWIASFQINAGQFGIGPGTRVAVLGGLVHSLALYGALEAVHLGAELHLLDTMRPDRQVAALIARQIELVYATPAQLRLLVEAGGAVPCLRLLLVGGSKLDPGLRAALARLAPGASVREFYGAAEASFITLADAASPPGCVGRAYPGVEIALRDGAVWVRSPYLFAGYGGEDQAGVDWDQGWLSIGEMGRMEAGNLYLSGRAGRMVTVADQNVFPEGIEGFMAELPGISRVAVIPVADGLRGAVMVAVVLGDSGKEAAILAATRRRFGAIAAPRALLWRDDWPQLASGKTDLAAITRAANLP